MNVIAPSGVGIKIIENVINVIKDKIKGGFDEITFAANKRTPRLYSLI